MKLGILGTLPLLAATCMPVAVVACTAADRQHVEAATQTALTTEQGACLIAEHYGSQTSEAESLVICQVSDAVGRAFLAGLRLADGINNGAVNPNALGDL